ncbi:MAG: transposase [Candidatus Omnitrophica bacterium]|nr:transposase [Candidatus Omnitrophota bacterium]
MHRQKAKLKNLILKSFKKNPYFGVRKIAKDLKEKHNIFVSKSYVHKILTQQEPDAQTGCKKSILAYKKKHLDDCGAFLLRAIDSHLGLFNNLTSLLQPHFPKLQAKLLKKIIVFFSLSSFLGYDLNQASEEKSLLRAADLYVYPARNIKYFLDQLNDCKPTISLDNFAKSLVSVASVKFSFVNGTKSYCDGSFSCFWGKPAFIDEFFVPYSLAQKRVKAIIKNKIIMINYTKSFDYLSSLTTSFIDGLASGIKTIELLDKKGNVLEEFTPPPVKMSFLIGYYPQILSKGVVFLRKSARFKKFDAIDGDIHYISALARFLQPKGSKGLILNSVLINRKRQSLPSWGLLTDKRSNFTLFLKRYLNSWPYMDKVFKEEMELVEKFYTQSNKTKELGDFVPEHVVLSKFDDFKGIGAILAAVFRDRVARVELRGKKGQVATGKDYLRIKLLRFSPAFKRKFNKFSFSIDKRNVFLI